MTTTEGRKQTSRDVARNCEAVLPRNSENPQESGRALGQSRDPRQKCRQASGETLEDPEIRADNPRVFRMRQIKPDHAGMMRKLADRFGASSKNVRDFKIEKDPQDQSGYLE